VKVIIIDVILSTQSMTYLDFEELLPRQEIRGEFLSHLLAYCSAACYIMAGRQQVRGEARRPVRIANCSGALSKLTLPIHAYKKALN
jgi:hypothetical protein